MSVAVLPWPYWPGNPYLPRLCAELERRGATILRENLPRGARLLRPGDWLHLHWPGHYLRHGWRWVYQRRRARFRERLAELHARGVRIAWTAHNLVPHDDPHPDLGHASRADLLGLVDHVFIHFEGARAALAAAFGYHGAATAIPHGHFADDYPEPPPPCAARRELGLPGHGRVVLLFGALRPYKGIAEAVGAFLRAAHAEDRLIIAGRPEGDVGRELALARRDSRIRLDARHIPAGSVPRYFAAADAFVVAHRGFFTSGSAVLALSLGCPIIGPAIHHLATLGGEPRLFAAEPTAEGIAAALARLGGAPAIDRATLRRWAREHLSWTEAGERAARVLLG